MRLVSLNGAEEVTHPTFGTATVGEDGVFDVPEDFGRALIAVSASWRDEAVHVAELARRERAELQDPRKALDVLATLRGKVADLETRLAESTDEATAARIGELEAEVADLREQLTAKPGEGESGDAATGAGDDTNAGDTNETAAGDATPAGDDAGHADTQSDAATDGPAPAKKAPAKKAAAKKATHSK